MHFFVQAYAIGVNNNTAMQIMRQDWKPGVVTPTVHPM